MAWAAVMVQEFGFSRALVLGADLQGNATCGFFPLEPFLPLGNAAPQALLEIHCPQSCFSGPYQTRSTP